LLAYFLNLGVLRGSRTWEELLESNVRTRDAKRPTREALCTPKSNNAPVVKCSLLPRSWQQTFALPEDRASQWARRGQVTGHLVTAQVP
jgi:hypothetical protein